MSHLRSEDLKAMLKTKSYFLEETVNKVVCGTCTKEITQQAHNSNWHY